MGLSDIGGQGNRMSDLMRERERDWGTTTTATVAAQEPKMDALCNEIVQKWVKISLSTEPVDFKAARATLEKIYHFMDLPTPKAREFLSVMDISQRPAVDRPIGARDILRLLVGVDNYNDLPHLDSIYPAMRARVLGSSQLVHDFLEGRTSGQTRNSGQLFPGSQVQGLHQQAMQNALNAQQQNALSGIHIQNQMFTNQVLGQFAQNSFMGHFRNLNGSEKYLRTCDLCSWAAVAEYMLHQGRAVDCQGWPLLLELAKNCFWVTPFNHSVWVSDRPAIMCLEHDRLNCEDGPAMAWRDRTMIPLSIPAEIQNNENLPAVMDIPRGSHVLIYALNGVEVPGKAITNPESYSATQIMNEPNQEVRRLLVKRYKGGQHRWMQDAGGTIVHKDKTGKLWRVERSYERAFQMVEVLNSTPEPDGSVRTYWLRVPPEITTATAGVAWTFGLTEREYNLTAQS